MRRLYLFIVILTLTTFISGNIYADTTYTIKKGDNPYKIAKKFKVKTQDIIKVNNLRPYNIKPGTKITIPSTKKGSLSKNKLAQKKGIRPRLDNVEAAKFQEDSSYHIVKRGDTLFSLSKKYSTSIGELKEINSLKSDLLKPGQKILLKHDLESEPKNYAAILSQSVRLDSEAHIEDDINKNSESKEPGLEELSMKERLILFAKNLLNIPYRFGGSSLFGIDCSAYVQKVYSLIGINLPRSAREQFSEGDPVDKGELSIGDLVFFRTYASFPSHVGIYLGNNLFIHASSKGKKVTIDSLETPYYLKRFIGAKRLIEGGGEEKGEPQKEG